MKAIHVEMNSDDDGCGDTFCGIESINTDPSLVAVCIWKDEPEAIQRATCEQCLLRIYMLGDSAAIGLKRLGRAVEVIDIPLWVEPS